MYVLTSGLNTGSKVGLSSFRLSFHPRATWEKEAEVWAPYLTKLGDTCYQRPPEAEETKPRCRATVERQHGLGLLAESQDILQGTAPQAAVTMVTVHKQVGGFLDHLASEEKQAGPSIRRYSDNPYLQKVTCIDRRNGWEHLGEKKGLFLVKNPVVSPV